LDRSRRIVNLFVISLADDPVIFDPGIDPDAVGMDERTDIVHLQIEPDITQEGRQR